MTTKKPEEILGDGINAGNRAKAALKPFVSIFDDLQIGIEAGIEARKQILARDELEAKAQKGLAAVQRETAELTAALPSLRAQVEELRTQLKHEREEHNRQTADFNTVLASREAKLQQLEFAIKTRAGELGRQIAEELV